MVYTLSLKDLDRSSEQSKLTLNDLCPNGKCNQTNISKPHTSSYQTIPKTTIDSRSSNRVITPRNFVEYECMTDFECNFIKIMNRSSCINHQCICKEPFLGDICELKWCGLFGIYNGLSSQCTCFPGYTGDLCNICVIQHFVTSTLYSNMCCNVSGIWSLVSIPIYIKQSFSNGKYIDIHCQEPSSKIDNKYLGCNCQIHEGNILVKPNSISEFIIHEKRKIDWAMNHYKNTSIYFVDIMNQSYKAGSKALLFQLNSGEMETPGGLYALLSFLFIMFLAVFLAVFFSFKWYYNSIQDYFETTNYSSKIIQQEAADYFSNKLNKENNIHIKQTIQSLLDRPIQNEISNDVLKWFKNDSNHGNLQPRIYLTIIPLMKKRNNDHHQNNIIKNYETNIRRYT